MWFGRLNGLLALVLFATPAVAITIRDTQRIKDPDGKTLAVVLKCNQCRTKAEKGPCLDGADDGYLDGDPCGECLINANFNARVLYPYDITITGTLLDGEGKPLENQFVRVKQPNGWSTTSRAQKDGKFRLLLGATQPRKGKTPVALDVGVLTYKKAEGKSGAFNLFLLPENFQPCTPKKTKGTAKSATK
jgi:hypothetical protein